MTIAHSTSRGPNVPVLARENESVESNATEVSTDSFEMIEYEDCSFMSEIKPESCPVTFEICEAAVEHYNKKHLTHYEFVEFVSGSIFLMSSFFNHCNFKAKDLSVSDEPKLFFAETKILGGSGLIVMVCKILDGAKESGCPSCDVETIAHPTQFRSKIRFRDHERMLSLRPHRAHIQNQPPSRPASTAGFVCRRCCCFPNMTIAHSTSRGPNVPNPASYGENKSEEVNSIDVSTGSSEMIEYEDCSFMSEIKPESCPVTFEICEAAVEHYNKKHLTHYEFVEFVSGSIFLLRSFFNHCNFKAKDISVSDEPKIFFAETKILRGSGLIVMVCKILDGAKESGCPLCDVVTIAHPARFKSKIRSRNHERMLSLRPRPSKKSRIC